MKKKMRRAQDQLHGCQLWWSTKDPTKGQIFIGVYVILVYIMARGEDLNILFKESRKWSNSEQDIGLSNRIE